MDALNLLVPLGPKFLALVPVIALVLVYIVPFLSDRYGLRRYPGPLAASLSSAWFANLVLKGNGISSVHKLHEKYGKYFHLISIFSFFTSCIGTFVRISPKHVSIADPQAMQIIYSYSTGTLKGDIYDGFVLPGRKPSIFATRHRDEHARKRKYLSHVMSMKSVLELEPNILHHQQALVQQWDSMCADGAKNKDGSKGACTWKARDGRVWFNCMPCENRCCE